MSLCSRRPSKSVAMVPPPRVISLCCVLAGQAGSYRLGQVQTPGFDSNPEMLSSASFRERHLRPGTVSLAVGAATGEGDGNGGYSPARSAGTEFLITTGPAPAPSLDGENVVFGRVLKGMDVVGEDRGGSNVQTQRQQHRVEPGCRVATGRESRKSARELEQTNTSHRHHRRRGPHATGSRDVRLALD